MLYIYMYSSPLEIELDIWNIPLKNDNAQSGCIILYKEDVVNMARSEITSFFIITGLPIL